VVVCPKFLNSIYGSHGPLGVKFEHYDIAIGGIPCSIFLGEYASIS
jgi:hypothetical protein